MLAVLAQFPSILGHFYFWLAKYAKDGCFLLSKGAIIHSWRCSSYPMVACDWLESGYLIEFRGKNSYQP
jgi:hypothetical protein